MTRREICSQAGKASAAKLSPWERVKRARKGALACNSRLSPEQRQARARKAAVARWDHR